MLANNIWTQQQDFDASETQLNQGLNQFHLC